MKRTSKPLLLVVLLISILLSSTIGCNTDRRSNPWGFDASTDVDQPAQAIVVKDLGVSQNSVCAVLDDHSLKCWGWMGWTGSVPPPSRKIRKAHQQLTPDGQFKAVEVGSGFACALRAESGEIECWHHPGDYGRVDFNPPIRRATDLEIGVHLACFRKENEQVKCWRASDVELGELTFRNAPDTFATGGYIGCVTYPERVSCGTIGSPPNDYFPPERSNTFAEQIAVGREHVAVLDDAGRTLRHAWHSDEREYLGWVTDELREGIYSSIEASSKLTCGILAESSELDCWGDLATGDTRGIKEPLQVPDGPFKSIELGSGQSACGIRPDGGMECFGSGIPDSLR